MAETRRSRGSIIQRGRDPRKWTIVLDLGRDQDGKRKRRWHSFEGSRRAVEKRLNELLTQADQGHPADNSKLRVADYLETWLRDVVAIRRRTRTLEGYSVIVHRHIIPHVGKVQLSKLQTKDVRRMEAALLASGLSANTVHHVHVCLSKALKDAVLNDDIALAVNVCQGVEPPSIARYEVQVPDAQAISRILSLAEATPYGPAFRFMAYTGIRRGEAVALQWENVDLERAVASIVATAQRHQGKGIVFQPTKSAAGHRGVAMDAGTVDMLRSHRGQQLLYAMESGPAYQDKGLVFPGTLGNPLDPSVLTRNFKKLAEKAGCPRVRLHDLRHGHCAGLIKAGVHATVASQRLGHADPGFTMRVYGHVAPGLQQEAAKAFAELMAGTIQETSG